MRRWTGLVTGAALLATGISPAMARGPGGGWGPDPQARGGYRHHDHDDGFGTFLGIAAVIGAVAIIASSASKNARDQDRRADAPPPRDYRGERDDRDGRYDDRALADEDIAANACAQAARDEASVDGGYAEVLWVGPDRRTSSGWTIDGRVERRDSIRDRSGQTRRFVCTVRDGRVADIRLYADAA